MSCSFSHGSGALPFPVSGLCHRLAYGAGGAMGSSCSTGNCEMINDQGHYGMSPKWFSEQEELAVYNSSQQVQFDSPYNDECLMFSAWNGYYDDQYGLIDLNNYTPQMDDFESSALAEYLHHGLSFLAIAAILAALVKYWLSLTGWSLSMWPR